MLKKSIRAIKIGNKEEIIMDFEDKRYEILSVFLFSEVRNFEEWIKEEFDLVISGNSDYREICGNVYAIEISPKTTKIIDTLAEDGMGNWCEVDTVEIRQLIDEWCEKEKEFKLTHPD